MQKTTSLLSNVLICLFAYLLMGLFAHTLAQSCDPSCGNAIECKDKIAKCQEAWDQMEVAKKPHVETLRKMEADIAVFQSRIKTIEADVGKKAAAIAQGEHELGGLLVLAGRRARQMYIRSSLASPLVTFFASSSIGSVFRTLAYQSAVVNEDKKTITQIAVSVKDLEDRKKMLEVERSSLAYLKEETDKRAASVRKLVGEASAYQSKLTNIIGALTTKQQQFISQKLAGLGLPTSLGAGPLYCTDDRKIDPGFRPAWAFFTFGIPHRVGMNQYGALGRAQAGQGYQDILRAYFDNISFERKDPNMKIKVQGYGEKTLEEYALRIYEMPESWPVEAQRWKLGESSEGNRRTSDGIRGGSGEGMVFVYGWRIYLYIRRCLGKQQVVYKATPRYEW
ncbi:MAG: hypothetical protein UY10_C0004G0009 [Microgenomates group bacterium GW2011_GWA2_47_8]|nr:MAG: hypothetical protein UY10_C0004G0009 [Microgenomates group bacterium GW2011_GWA2_47_8]